MNIKHVIDLFSGLGGWTQSFMDSHKYDVHRYDSDPWLRDVENTEIMCLLTHKVASIAPINLLVGSPPCYEFSLAHSAPRSIAIREGRPYKPDIRLIEVYKEHIDRLKPKYWILENVRGSAEFINPILEQEPRQIVGPFLLWGNFPLLDLSESELKVIKEHKKKAGDKYRWSEHRSSYRAFIPEPMSRALMRAVSSPTLEDFL